MKKSSQAFTLVELLVVIVIISILAGIALPVFQKAQEKGRVIVDLANLRQLGIAVQAYKGDNDGNLLDSDPAAKVWPQQLNPTYVSSWKVFKSPFDNRPAIESTSAPVSYGINNEAGANGTILGIDNSKINFPSSLILFAPVIDTSRAAVTFKTFIGTTSAVVTAPAIAAKGTHGARLRVDVVYADGHAEDILWLKFMDKASAAAAGGGKLRWIFDNDGT